MPPLSIMIKPASSLCNLRCEYCFYHDVSSHRENPSFGLMTEETAENIIRSALDFANGDSVAFAFQGGEPLLVGKDYFKFFVETVRKYNLLHSTCYFSIQTNGTLVDAEWADFFTENEFLVGLSLDGDYGLNRFRVDEKGQNCFYKVMKAAEIFKNHGTQFNILTVLTGENSQKTDRLYRFFRSKGFTHLQFIPCLRPFGDKSESKLHMTQQQYYDFLTTMFNFYAKDFFHGRYTSIRYFDNIVRMSVGEKPEQCGMCGHCSHQFVVEGNGNVYPCDFYCTDEWLLGNINQTGFDRLADGQKAIAFLRESLQGPDKCRACSYYWLCRSGGCKRQREDTDYCEAYHAFFSSCMPLLNMFRARGRNGKLKRPK